MSLSQRGSHYKEEPITTASSTLYLHRRSAFWAIKLISLGSSRYSLVNKESAIYSYQLSSAACTLGSQCAAVEKTLIKVSSVEYEDLLV